MIATLSGKSSSNPSIEPTTSGKPSLQFMSNVELPVSVESDCSKNLKADLQEDRADSLFIKSPQSAKAENRRFKMH